jgi:predicted transcriptional regulator
MTQINELNQIDDISASDLVRVWDTSNGSERSASLSQVADFLGIASLPTQYSTPTASPFSIAANVGWLIIQPIAAYAVGEVILPAAVHGQEVSVVCTQAVAAFSVVGSAIGAPTSLAAGGFFTMRYDESGQVWYRVA